MLTYYHASSYFIKHKKIPSITIDGILYVIKRLKISIEIYYTSSTLQKTQTLNLPRRKAGFKLQRSSNDDANSLLYTDCLASIGVSYSNY